MDIRHRAHAVHRPRHIQWPVAFWWDTVRHWQCQPRGVDGRAHANTRHRCPGQGPGWPAVHERHTHVGEERLVGCAGESRPGRHRAGGAEPDPKLVRAHDQLLLLSLELTPRRLPGARGGVRAPGVPLWVQQPCRTHADVPLTRLSPCSYWPTSSGTRGIGEARCLRGLDQSVRSSSGAAWRARAGRMPTCKTGHAGRVPCQRCWGGGEEKAGEPTTLVGRRRPRRAFAPGRLPR